MIEVNSVRLFLPQAEVQHRVGADPSPLSQYIQRLLMEIDTYWQQRGVPQIGGMLIAIGVGPGRESRTWCQAVAGELPETELRDLEEQLDSIAPLVVQHGPIAFAIDLRLHGAQNIEFPPIPQIWLEAAQSVGREVTMPDGLFELIWPEGLQENSE